MSLYLSVRPAMLRDDWAEGFHVLKLHCNAAQDYCDLQLILWYGGCWGCGWVKIMGLPFPEPFPHTLFRAQQQGGGHFPGYLHRCSPSEHQDDVAIFLMVSMSLCATFFPLFFLLVISSSSSDSSSSFLPDAPADTFDPHIDILVAKILRSYVTDSFPSRTTTSVRSF